MPVRPPNILAPKDTLPRDPVSAALDHEILAEKAATYARLLKRLEQTLAALREFEAGFLPLTANSPETGSASPPPGGRPNGRASMASRATRGLDKSRDAEYQSLLNTAGQALWYVMIQRELCGFRRHDLFYKELNVPAAVRLRMGLVRAR